ncbi:protein BUNDLE SHEATH DEFECTIVE 2, chloroplastic [Andrographis paniculata]|uniref:protein BUNDLE SHEATH DEFECTIVE 2, chloroplastic n=1 Tax=Andrographis paniculata TaxID=175694 RepID=UPI0021E8CD90|nr:protein BUNDLE SHEATH DEFECTIVE 2, chloroplastic [Andrographis paniculata]
MTNSLCLSPILSFNSINKPGLISHEYASRKVSWIDSTNPSCKSGALQPIKAVENQPGTKSNNIPGTKPNSIICADCDGNGCKQCTQCLGKGVNSVDHFNGQFKAGAMCWLCRGKKEILCGSCNGAGFLGGFLSSFDD